MPDNEYGPFQDERQALATRAAAVLRAAFEANPGVGAGDPERLRLLTGACEAAGVELGDYDLRLLRWVAGWEDATCVQLAGMIHRAYQAGKAAVLAGAVTEWGVTLEGGGNEPFATAADEDDARRFAAGFPRSRTVVVRREAGPWTPVPGEDGDHE